MGSVRSLTAAVDVRSGAVVVNVVKSVRWGEFTENAAIMCRCKRLVGTRVKAHPAVSAKQEGTSRCLIGDDVHPYRK